MDVLMLPLFLSLSLAGPADAAPTTRPATVRIAMCQILGIDSDREGNFQRIETALAEAKRQGAAIACFPEGAILGWVNPEAHQLAHPIPGPDTDRLAALARRHDVMLCVGVEEKDGDKLHDSVVLIDRRGRILLKHRKINTLVELMTPPYTRGTTVEAAETEHGRIGLLICADTFDPKLLERMRDRRADLLLVPYGWAAEDKAWPGHGDSLRDTVTKAAKAVGAPVVGTDLIGEITHGPWTGRTYGGQSVAADADGRVLVRGKDREAQVLLVDVPTGHRSFARQE